MATKTDLKVFDELAIVTIRGHEPPKGTDEIDPPGSANWLCTAYGMNCEEFDPQEPGILWTDYDAPSNDPWSFAVLIAKNEIEMFRREVKEGGYDVVETEIVAEPMVFGDGSGTVVVMKHPDGWVLVS